MQFKMTRYQSTAAGTFSQMTVGPEVFYTVEKPWLNNKPFISCLPAGNYKLVPHKSPKYGDVFCIVDENAGVTIQQESFSKRYACLFHVANYARDVLGCVGVGQYHHNNMVTNSKISMSKLYDIAPLSETHDLEIIWGEI